MSVDIPKLMELIAQHSRDVDACNAMYKEHGINSKECKLADAKEKESGAVLCEYIARQVQVLIADFAKAGVELRDVTIEEQYKTPYHSFYAKIEKRAFLSKHIEVPGYPYRRKN